MRTIFIFLVLVFSFIGCNKCKDSDCPSNATFEYILVDKAGNNLLALPNNYNKDSIKIIGYRGEGTNLFIV